MTDTFTTTIRRGLAWTRTLTVEIDDVPVNWTGYTCAARIGDLTLTEADGVTLGNDGTIVLALTAEQTAAIAPAVARITVDLVSGGGVTFEPRIRGEAAVES
jgi:hypothetical protein